MAYTNTRQLPDAKTLAEIDRLPDRALVHARAASWNGGWYAAVDIKDTYVSDPDFSTCGRSEADAIKVCADKIRADLRGEGKYAPHWDAYDVKYRLLPHWRTRQ